MCFCQRSLQSEGDGREQPSYLFLALDTGLGPLHPIFQVILTVARRDRDFTDEETEAPRGLALAQCHTVSSHRGCLLVLLTLEPPYHVVDASGEALDHVNSGGVELRGGLIGCRGPPWLGAGIWKAP